ncbi:hypothetical protein [Sporosarcina ureilytica]|nr:hypothetical protein [Sporosarcina ureilytica]
MLEALITDINQYSLLLISTTSRNSVQISRLPDKNLNGQPVANILLTDRKLAQELFRKIDGQIENILIDVERKQEINLMEIANEVIKRSRVLPYKPNDVTLEAADQLILHQLGVDLAGKKVLVYGTGNIAFKLALRLLEREVDVLIEGRDPEKIQSIVTTLNMIKPRYSCAVARPHQEHIDFKYDGLISFLSSEKIIETKMSIHIKPSGFAIDGGIGNFQGTFIAAALEKDVSVLRLDVRLGNPFLFAGITSLSDENEFFNTVIGSNQVGSMKLVAGGVIGEAGSIIVDRIKSPTQIIGIANGYGGLKDEKQFTEEDRKNLHYAKETFI